MSHNPKFYNVLQSKADSINRAIAKLKTNSLLPMEANAMMELISDRAHEIEQIMKIAREGDEKGSEAKTGDNNLPERTNVFEPH